jgi:hypothetical protein
MTGLCSLVRGEYKNLFNIGTGAAEIENKSINTG